MAIKFLIKEGVGVVAIKAYQKAQAISIIYWIDDIDLLDRDVTKMLSELDSRENDEGQTCGRLGRSCLGPKAARKGSPCQGRAPSRTSGELLNFLRESKDVFA